MIASSKIVESFSAFASEEQSDGMILSSYPRTPSLVLTPERNAVAVPAESAT